MPFHLKRETAPPLPKRVALAEDRATGVDLFLIDGDVAALAF